MRRPKRNPRRAATVIEATLIAGALFGLTFLLLDVTMAIFLRSTFQHAVREGVRLGITGWVPTPSTCQDDTIKAAVKANALGFLNSTTAASSIHVHFTSPADGSLTDNAPGNIIGVTVEAYQYRPLGLFLRSGSPLIWARAYDVMETYPGAKPPLCHPE